MTAMREVRLTSDLLHYEDFPEGLVIPFGTYHLSKEEVIAYAREWDPQPFHLDEEAAKNSVLGGLAASGWQSSAILVRLAVDAYANTSAAMASSGMEEAKWLKPVYAGETLTGRATVLSRRVSAKRPEMGILKMKFELMTTAGEPKVEIIGIQFMKVRNP
jgi:acyl dehydratase